jgi:hypothetical protein
VAQEREKQETGEVVVRESTTLKMSMFAKRMDGGGSGDRWVVSVFRSTTFRYYLADAFRQPTR